MAGVVARGSSLSQKVQSVEVRREELEHLAIKRWNSLDTLVVRSIGMFLGAVFVSFVSNFRPDQMDASTWYTIMMVSALAVAPIILLYITKYNPPSSVSFERGGNKFEFIVCENVRVAFYMNSVLKMPDVIAIESRRDERHFTLQEAGSQYVCMESPSLRVDLSSEEWPEAELGQAAWMIRAVNTGEVAGCLADIQLMTTKVVIQVVCWSIRDFIKGGTPHTWRESQGADALFAGILFLVFTALTWTTQFLQQKSYASYHSPPFRTAMESCSTGVKRILSAYLEVTLMCLPLSVGYSWNQVTIDWHRQATEAADLQMTDGSRSDYRGSVLLFSYAVYFLVLCVITVTARVYARSVFAFMFEHQIPKKVVGWIDTTCCICSCCDRTEEEEEAKAKKEADEAAEAAAAVPLEKDGAETSKAKKEESSPEEGVQAKDLQEQSRLVDPPLHTMPKPAMPEASPHPGDVEEGTIKQGCENHSRINMLERKVRKLEKALGIYGTPPRHPDEPDPIVNRHWKAVTIATADQVSIKTLQFLFAWATLYLIEHFYYVYLVQCSRNSSDPWATPCVHTNSLALSLILSVMSFGYLYQIAGLRKQTVVHEAFFDLQTQALPLTLGWTWKGFADDLMDKLKTEWTGRDLTVVYIVLFVTLYIFAILVFHTYSIISRDQRAKYASLEFE